MSSNPFAMFKQAPSLRPMWNIGALFDIQTGKYYKGKYGESILCGGLNHFTGVAGLPNMFKTVISLFQLGSVMNRVSLAIMMAHDSENTLSPGRIMNVFSQFPELFGTNLIDDGRLLFTDASTYTGNEWWTVMREYAVARRADKNIMITTPFVDETTKELVKIPSPTLAFLDSLSGLQTEGVMDMYEKGQVGGKELNMVAMKGAGAKSQLIDQVTGVTSGSGLNLLMTAHVGQEYQLDMYKPNVKRLKFLKGDLKLKKVPENFSFLTANCWYCVSLTPMMDGDKLPEFPRSDEDDLKGDTDLICITMVNLRGKSGPSGVPFEVVVSQSEGLKPELTEFVYCKGFDYFGISDKDGNKAKGKPNFRLDLHPSVNLTRKSIRLLLESDQRLKRAMNITAELCMMGNLWHELPAGLLCDPKELYADLLAQGYDWELLLDTRGFWLPLEEKGVYADIPFLSTMDLLNMRAGTYRPYWYDAAVKAKAKVSVALATAAEASAGTVDTKPLVAADLINAIAERKAAKAA
ncbi:hypothetical protein D9M68_17470 [compost metagenome]